MKLNLKEHDVVVLTAALPEEGLQPGDVGAIVHIYPEGDAYEVEFVSYGGDTIAVATVPANRVRPISSRDVKHARPLVAA